ncbi:MAG TPA: TetR/AcrR family transcriptional regulator [Solirubrobacter sp.]|nr:TetR/AcrR family transcriptional regulator [Solirubrobacter sp.]
MPTTERPLRRDAELNRQRILAAAGELFSERGLCVTLDDVAHHAGVGVGTVYRRFPNKEVLIDALFERRMQALADVAAQARAEPDPWRAIVQFFERGCELQAHDRGLKELLASNAHGGPCLVTIRDRLRATVAELFTRAQAAGVVRADAAPADAPLIHLMLGVVMDRARDVDPELWRRYLALVLDGLRADGPALPVEPLTGEQLDVVLMR